MKKKNKNGFTLIELIIAISILAVIIAFALPNITSTLENYKKEQMIIDAKDMVEKAKNYILTGKGKYPEGDDDDICKKGISLKEIDPRVEIKDSPYGEPYKRDVSIVQVCKSEESYTYKVTLKDETNSICLDFDWSVKEECNS